ncbi:MAG TPA: endonuclease, partial [Stenotrophomonas sp.]|nr:endonuclease [Stenotrophomonas sp.]
RLTFHDFSGKPTVELDWILVRGFSVDRFGTLDDAPGGVLPSDHFPVQAELRFPAAAAP